MTRHYTRDHEWIEITGDTGIVGISDYAQSQLGDITFVEVPAIGARFAAGASAAVVESVKAASDIYMPLAGEVIAVNEALDAAPELVNSDAEGEGWLFRVRLSDPATAATLLDEAAYAAFVAEL